MLKYQSHKIVEAQDLATPGIEISPGDAELRVRLNGQFLGSIPARMYPGDRNKFLDGYLVKYSDGYISWSPRKAFEEGYTRID